MSGAENKSEMSAFRIREVRGRSYDVLLLNHSIYINGITAGCGIDFTKTGREQLHSILDAAATGMIQSRWRKLNDPEFPVPHDTMVLVADPQNVWTGIRACRISNGVLRTADGSKILDIENAVWAPMPLWSM